MERIQLDAFKGETKVKKKDENAQAMYKFKFIVKTLQKEIVLFARTKEEREIWIESFEKIIDLNTNGALNINQKARADSCLQIMDQCIVDRIKLQEDLRKSCDT